MRLVLYTGKGGVGKTTTAAATAVCAAERGVRTLVVSTDIAHSLGDVVGCELAPIPVAIETKWGGGEVVKYTDAGRISNVGIENLRGVSEFDITVRQTEHGNIDRHPYYGEEYYSDENHYWTFITIDNAKNAWVRNVTAMHFAGCLVSVNAGSKWTTVQECISLEPISMRWGGRRFTYKLSGQLNLVQRCTSDKGRHSFVLGGHQAAGPNVFLDCSVTAVFEQRTAFPLCDRCAV